MESLLAKSGVHGNQKPHGPASRNELMEGELKERIKRRPIRWRPVIRPGHAQGNQKWSQASPALFMCLPLLLEFLAVLELAWGQGYATSSYMEEDTYVSTEFNLYNTKDEKLLWSGETDTVYTKDFGKLAREYAKALVKQLRKDKVIGQNDASELLKGRFVCPLVIEGRVSQIR